MKSRYIHKETTVSNNNSKYVQMDGHDEDHETIEEALKCYDKEELHKNIINNKRVLYSSFTRKYIYIYRKEIYKLIEFNKKLYIF